MTFSDIVEYLANVGDLGTSVFTPMLVMQDEMQSDRNIIRFSQTDLILPARESYFTERNSTEMMLYESVYAQVLEALGANATTAAKDAKDVVDFEIELAYLVPVVAIQEKTLLNYGMWRQLCDFLGYLGPKFTKIVKEAIGEPDELSYFTVKVGYPDFILNDTALNEKTSMVNGKLTLGENIADCGGIREAFRAYRSVIKERGQEEDKYPTLPYTQDQLFFIGFAQSWCSLVTAYSLRTSLLTDVHSPNDFRVMGSIQNSDDFGRVFNCSVGKPMNPQHKCQAWCSNYGPELRKVVMMNNHSPNNFSLIESNLARESYFTERNSGMMMLYERAYIFVLVVLGADATTAAQDAKDVVDFEIQLAHLSFFTVKVGYPDFILNDTALNEKTSMVNGKLTLGENIADCGGIRQAFRSWCSLVRPSALTTWLLSEVHTPNDYRVMGAIQNSDDFGRVFNCSVGKPMNPQHKCLVFYGPELRKVVMMTNHSPNNFRVIGSIQNKDFGRVFNCPVGKPMNPKHKCEVW
ncbi:hypothetical protein C0Q70_03849 [Pomacea canaliculata]|uniref:Peptidase M13 C-terminal domain-containing protein n=1 Tax=Pomacea canaliculata TaxID=400727 RepID=A0A2T7PTX0_POMCA|nr:hypothetical protein C0Q70_03849 [Pomacea canaliculata]